MTTKSREIQRKRDSEYGNIEEKKKQKKLEEYIEEDGNTGHD